MRRQVRLLISLREKERLSCSEEVDLAEVTGEILAYLFNFIDTLSSDEIEKVYRELECILPSRGD